MNLKKVCSAIEERIAAVFSETRLGISAREDSRAFGAMIEKRVIKSWKKICQDMEFEFVPIPGRRSIFDFACKIDGQLFGFDVKTKDLDSKIYSDGGVCAVGNLLKYMANDKAMFVIIEFGHNKSNSKNESRDIEYIRVAPFHSLPVDIYRIENLGTGQVRLNYTINQAWNEINWDRQHKDFFDIFSGLAISHYQKVHSSAEKRIQSIIEFKKLKYAHFRFIK